MAVKVLEKDPSQERKNDIRIEMFKNDIHTKTPEEVIQLLLKLEEQIGLTMKGDSYAPIKIGFDLFCKNSDTDDNGLPTSFDADGINEMHKRQQSLMIALFHHARKNEFGDMVEPDVNGDELKVVDRIKRLIVMNNDAFDQVTLYVRQNTRINFPTIIPGDDMYRCTTMDEDDDNSPFQKLLLYLLSTTSKLDMRRYKGQVCQQILRTKAWKPVMQISDFIYLNCQKETKYDMWKNITAKGTMVKDTVNFMDKCIDVQFPQIVKNRNVWSFKNGLFVGKEWSGSEWVCKYYPYESSEFTSLDPTIISSKYFDQDFPTDQLATKNWYDIPTPNMQTVLDFQQFPEDVCKWLYVFAGRLMYDVGDIEQWQIIPFFKGIARSGKSTLVTKVFKKFYDAEDVRTLSNNIEKKFGLWSICDGFMFISPEVKGDLCLDQAEFQSMVSGEDVSIARKFDTALSIQWKTPGVFAGNEVPGWKDNSGSIIRRLLTFNFGKQVIDADPKLDEKLDAEIPSIMLKCVRAYLEYAQKYGDKDIWVVVPEYFRQVQNQIAMVTNSLQHFMSSEKIRYGSELKCPQKLFVQMFNQHCLENNLGRYKFNPDFYAGPFSGRDISVKMETATYNGKPYIMQSFIQGLDMVQEAVDFSDDY